MRKLVVICFVFISIQLPAQDSLYLVGTITGESYNKRITGINRVGDVNDDGYADFIIASRTGRTRNDQGVVQLYFGSATLDLTPDVTFHYPCCDTLNNIGNASEIGDVNGDGYDDFTISGIFGDWGFVRGKVFIFYGGETIDTIPVAEYYENTVQDYFGSVVEEVGDLNRDGYDDFLICSSYNWSDGKGHVYLFWGGDSISWERSTTFTSEFMEDFFGTSAANIGDINSDGFEDIAIGAPAHLMNNDTAKVYFYCGGKEMDNVIDTIFRAKNGSEEMGNVIKNGGDINNDGAKDFLISSWDGIVLYPKIDSSIKFNGYPYIGTDGDFNNDGFSDFVIVRPNYINRNIQIFSTTYIYLGKENIDTNYSYKLLEDMQYGVPDNIYFSDLNGDSFDDILFIRPSYPDYDNRKGKVYIYSYKDITDVKEYNVKVYKYNLSQNYPNPFNPVTNIKFSIPSVETHRDASLLTTLKVYDVLGKEVATLVNEEKPAGSYEIDFNAHILASGIYYYQLRAVDPESSSGQVFVETKKMILLK